VRDVSPAHIDRVREILAVARMSSSIDRREASSLACIEGRRRRRIHLRTGSIGSSDLARDWQRAEGGRLLDEVAADDHSSR